MTIDIEILQFLHYHPLANRTEIMAGLTKAPSDSTMKRLLSAAVKEGNIETAGRGPATKYKLTPQAHVTMPLDLATYFDKDIDEREVQESFNFDLIRDVLTVPEGQPMFILISSYPISAKAFAAFIKPSE